MRSLWSRTLSCTAIWVRSRIEAIRRALKEITIPLIGSTITPVVVFIPLIVITGVYGVFFRALAVTMTVSLLTSLGLALTWTPNLSQYFIKGRKEKEPAEAPADDETDEDDARKMLAAEEKHLSGFFLRVVNFHERWLRRALERPLMLVIFSVALIGVSFICFNYSDTDLLPEMDEGGFVLDYLMPAGSSLAETNRVVSHLEKMLRETRRWRARRDALACN